MSYTDLHLHLLGGVDDGARDERQSIEFARRMVREGVHEAAVTPHVGSGWPVAVETIPERTARLQRALDREGLELRLHTGGEIHPDGARGLRHHELELISHGPPGSRWVLMEVPFAGVDERFIETCRIVRGRGYGLLIAHPERAAGLLPAGLDLLRGELAAGSLLQVNVCSLLGNHGPEAQSAAVTLVRDGLAFVLASDAHPGSREHTLRPGFDLALRAGASSLQAFRLTQGNPRFLLRHGIPPAPGFPEPDVERPLAAPPAEAH